MKARKVITPPPKGIAGTFTRRNDFLCPRSKTSENMGHFRYCLMHDSKSQPPTQRQDT